MRSFRAFGGLAVATLFGVVGCGPMQSDESNVGSAAASFAPSSRVHTMPFGVGQSASEPGTVHAATTAHLTYYGGKVIANAKIAVVFWGPNVNSTVTSGIGGFYTAVTNSAYFDWLSEYNTGSQSIGRGSLLGTYTISPSQTSGTIDDTAIQTELNNQINAGHLPAPDGNTLFMTYFPPGMTITQGGSSSCVSGGFCAYHGTFNATRGETYYGIMPDMGSGSGCATGCGNSTMFNNMTSVSSHEMIEAVTDAEVGLATVVGAPLAWYDSTNGEIGDICNAQQGSIAGYTVQKQWDNATNTCIVSKATGDTTAPTTSITAPTSGATVSGTAVTVSASASDNVGVTKVEFYVDGSLISTDTTSPYSISWNSTGTTNGSHTLTSKAYDAAGNVGTSTGVGVTVNNGGGGGGTLANGGFESGATVWSSTSGVINNDSTLSRTGSWEAYLDGYGTTHTDTLSQTFTAPSPASQLCYWLKITTSETTTTTAYDTLTVQLKNSAGTVVSTQSYSNLNHNTAYAQHCFSISSYGGQTITLAFTGTEDSSLATNFFVDDVTAI